MNLNDRFCAPAGRGAVGRYTTPTHIFTVPFDTGTISMLAVIYKQDDKVVLVKDLSDCELGDKTVSCCLTEAETALFSATPQVQIQLRVGIGNARLRASTTAVFVANSNSFKEDIK